MSEQSLVVYFHYDSLDLEPILALEDDVSDAIEQSGAGEYDGHELGLFEASDAFLFMYGPSADKLYESVRPVLEGSALLKGGEATLRYGGPDDDSAPERRIKL
ncbi:MAG: hypothetical protein F9K44_08865 [Hyphomicrobiaceae bacterium]|nr:MAG: hypothetical protein F9K44_08865 [Hyphomicrobiaceae bacterium]